MRQWWRRMMCRYFYRHVYDPAYYLGTTVILTCSRCHVTHLYTA